MFTWIGILTSDSGNESILKFVLERNGLSGMILLEHDMNSSEIKMRLKNLVFQILNIV
jgi:hypothetical protein